MDGETVIPRGAFIRFDVFGAAASDQAAHDRALGWYSSVSSWLSTNPDIRMFNRNLSQEAGLKGYNLNRAAAHGLPIPKTSVTNRKSDIEALAGKQGLIAKPTGGGSYTVDLDEMGDEIDWRDGVAPAPAFIQEKLSYPEYRVYLIGEKCFVFASSAQTLDYRLDRNADTRFVPAETIDMQTRQKLVALTKDLGLDFCAFDLKTRTETGEFCFLEVNSGPMFAAFDAIAGGELTKAMLHWLCPPA